MKTVDCSHRQRAGPAARAPDADRLPGAERSTCTRAQRPAQRTSALPHLNLMPPTSPAILWMAPAFSGGGYSSEALAFAQGLMPLLGKRFKLRQFAEQADESFFHGLPESLTKPLLLRFDFPNADAWKGTVVCHSPPDAWRPSKFPGWDQLAPCPPPNAKFVIGRTIALSETFTRPLHEALFTPTAGLQAGAHTSASEQSRLRPWPSAAIWRACGAILGLNHEARCHGGPARGQRSITRPDLRRRRAP